MNHVQHGYRLINDLLADPMAFEHHGRGNDLLTCYFEGLPIMTLGPLLRHEDSAVRSTAAFVATELGSDAAIVIGDIIPLLHDEDLQIRWNSLEAVMMCSVQDNVEYFVYVPCALESELAPIRGLAMRLMCKASSSQIDAAIAESDVFGANKSLHLLGLHALENMDRCEPQMIYKLLSHEAAIARKYGAIAAVRLLTPRPELVVAARASADSEVRDFVATILRSDTDSR